MKFRKSTVRPFLPVGRGAHRDGGRGGGQEGAGAGGCPAEGEVQTRRAWWEQHRGSQHGLVRSRLFTSLRRCSWASTGWRTLVRPAHFLHFEFGDVTASARPRSPGAHRSVRRTSRRGRPLVAEAPTAGRRASMLRAASEQIARLDRPAQHRAPGRPPHWRRGDLGQPRCTSCSRSSTWRRRSCLEAVSTTLPAGRFLVIGRRQASAPRVVRGRPRAPATKLKGVPWLRELLGGAGLGLGRLAPSTRRHLPCALELPRSSSARESPRQHQRRVTASSGLLGPLGGPHAARGLLCCSIGDTIHYVPTWTRTSIRSRTSSSSASGWLQRTWSSLSGL